MARFGTSDVVNGVNTRGYRVLGTKTTVAQLPTSGTASYKAVQGLRADIYQSNDSSTRSKVKADVDLNVDFASTQISGEFNNLTFGDGSTDPAIFKLKPATVANGSFSTTVTIENANAGQTLTASSVNGAFFGNEAQEVGGDLSFTGTGNNGGFVGAGVFGATKQ